MRIHEFLQTMNKMGGRQFHTLKTNTTHEHFLKVVSTRYVDMPAGSGISVGAYDYTVNSHQYRDSRKLAAARFSYDLSPMAVTIRQETVPLYRFVTSTCAIVGGFFTTLGLVDSFLYNGLSMFGRKGGKGH